jgi:multiple sugar transport system ATP-binding protein
MATVTLKNIGAASLKAGLDLAIRDREFVVLTGPAGCGSSAIVRLIAGLEDVLQGDILFDERRANDLPPKDRDVAMLSHDYTPYPGLSVRENLAIGMERRKFANSEIEKRLAAVAEMLGLRDRLSASPKSLSPEERRFVGLGRAIVLQPKLYLFDEPFANLGRTAASRGRAAIAELRQRSSATILYATSDPAEALALGARTVIMDDGIVQQNAEAQSIFGEPANVFVAKFFGDPPMNLVHGAIKQERDGVNFSETGDGTIAVHLPAPRFSGAKELAGRPIILGFRPEAVEIAASPSTGGGSGTSFRALVDRAELKGPETDLYLRTGAHELVCRSRLWAGQGEGGHRFQFEIELEKAHLFDAASGRRVTLEP